MSTIFAPHEEDQKYIEVPSFAPPGYVQSGDLIFTERVSICDIYKFLLTKKNSLPVESCMSLEYD